MFPPRTPDPTPQEIAAACAEIQATWTPTVRESRRRGDHTSVYEAPGVEAKARLTMELRLGRVRDSLVDTAPAGG